MLVYGKIPLRTIIQGFIHVKCTVYLKSVFLTDR